MKPQFVKAELCVKVNFNLNCSEFLDYVSKQKDLITASKSEQKYKFKKKLDKRL